MANQRKLIGRLPVFKGEWSSLETYNKLNEVTLYGSSFRSKIDGNTYKPAELNSSGTGMTVNENWYVVANGTDAYLAGEKIASIDGNTSTYNVSRFHQHTGFWEAVEYDESEPAYLEAQEYKAGNRVNLANYTNHTFVAMKDMTGVMPDYNNISNKFTLEEAILFVPSKYRLTGMNVGFLDSSNKPVVHKHKGGTFTNVANWEEDVHEKLAELSSQLSTITNFNNDGFLYFDGEIHTSQPGSFKHTGYLKVDINYPIIFRADTVNEYLNYINFYDADKKFISGLSNTETDRSINNIEPENIPHGTRYIIVCDKTKNVDSFVSYHPFMEQNVHRFVDTPKSKNIYCPLYSCCNLNSLDDTKRYDMPVFIVRNREYNTLTISKRSYGYFLEIYFYDIDNTLVGSVKNKKEGTIDIPSTCEYIGFTDYGKELKDGGKSMVNWGSEVIEYVPYDSFFMQAFINKEYLNTYTKKAGVQFPFKEKGFVNASGTINTTQSPESFRFTDYIKIESNSYIMYLGNSANEYVNVISFYDSDKNYISGISNIDTVGNEILHIISPVDIPEGTRYIICTAKTTQVDNNSAYLLCTPFRDNDNSVRIIDKPAGKNIYNQNYSDVSDFNYREIVKCPVLIERDRKYDTLTISKRALNYYLIVIFLDADFCEISKISDKREGDTLNIPSTCQYVQFKDYVGELSAGKSMVNWGSEILEYEPYKSVTANYSDTNFFKNRYYHKESGFLATGSLVIDNVPNVKYNQTISLNARVETVGKITLSHGKTTYAAGMIDIDDTNIYTYALVPESSETIPHGLTFNKFIECIIRQDDEATATVIIRTLGGEFKRENIPFLGCRDDVMLEAEGSNLSDIKLSYTCADFGKEIWSFGDSYFEKIPAKLKELGYNNSLFDAFSGRNSIQALSSLKKMIGIVGIPKLIYWPMGMNDPDTEESANSNWEKALNELINICRCYNIELVLATIPNIPTRNHEKKNDIVRNSGYRYADINKAVGADIDPNWYDGLISNDKVHPSLNAGDYVIAMEVINAIPELRI